MTASTELTGTATYQAERGCNELVNHACNKIMHHAFMDLYSTCIYLMNWCNAIMGFGPDNWENGDGQTDGRKETRNEYAAGLYASMWPAKNEVKQNFFWCLNYLHMQKFS